MTDQKSKDEKQIRFGNDRPRKAKTKSRFPSGMTDQKSKDEKQIPFGNDKQKRLAGARGQRNGLASQGFFALGAGDVAYSGYFCAYSS
jgi:hypothetical protein